MTPKSTRSNQKISTGKINKKRPAFHLAKMIFNWFKKINKKVKYTFQLKKSWFGFQN